MTSDWHKVQKHAWYTSSSHHYTLSSSGDHSDLATVESSPEDVFVFDDSPPRRSSQTGVGQVTETYREMSLPRPR